MDIKIKLSIVVGIILIVAIIIGWSIWLQYEKNNPIVNTIIQNSNICGGWNILGERVCQCSGNYKKADCPAGAMCDAGNYYCYGLCGACKCYQGSASRGNEIPCN